MLYLIFDKIISFFFYLHLLYLKIKNYCKNNDIPKYRLLLENNSIVKYNGRLNWNYITRDWRNVKCIEVKYIYKNNNYRIIYEYPLSIKFPLDFNKISRTSFLLSDKYESILKQYAGPNRDFYQGQFKQRLEFIFLFNNIRDTFVEITNNRLDDIIIQKDENIII